MKRAAIVVVCVLASLVVPLPGCATTDTAGDKTLLQDDIHVKPKGNGALTRTLEWSCAPHGVIPPGYPKQFGDDIFERLTKLDALETANGQWKKADAVKFNVSGEDVLVEKKDVGYQWSFSKDKPAPCKHFDTCKDKGHGIPPEFMGELKGDLMARFHNTNKFVPVVEVHMKGR